MVSSSVSEADAPDRYANQLPVYSYHSEFPHCSSGIPVQADTEQ